MTRAPRPAEFDISQVERDTGLSKDTLRMWERRYGFPLPARDVNGERRYGVQDIEKLRLLKRLIDSGLRPGKLMVKSRADLARLDVVPPRSADARTTRKNHVDAILATIQTRDGQALLGDLSALLLRQGLHRFVVETLAPLNIAIGDAWAQGTIATFDEHLYTEQVQTLLRMILVNMPRRAGSPRFLLTTVPREQHGLGLLMVEVLLAAENVFCNSLGTQTPVTDIAQAAHAQRSDIVALSFASSFPLRAAIDSVAALRSQLPAGAELWIGGELVRRMRKPAAGVRHFTDLESIASALLEWRARGEVVPNNRR